MPGVEADDVIGTLATRVAAAGGEVVIVTGDKDFQQLVGRSISLLDPMFDRRTDVAQVRERYGIEPERWVDIIGLMGDAIDNIPGIRGIGEKTASALITHARSLEALLADPDGIADERHPRRRRADREGPRACRAGGAREAPRDDPLRPRDRRDPRGLSLCRTGPRRRSRSICRELEFHRLLREIPLLDVVVPEGERPSCPVALDGREGPEVLGDVAAALRVGLFVDATTEGAMLARAERHHAGTARRRARDPSGAARARKPAVTRR